MFHALLTPRISCRALRPVTVALVALAALAGMLALPAHAPAVNLPPGFEESMAFTDLDQPISMQFSQDGRVFVAEKSGIIKVFDGMGDTTPTTFADLRTQVHNYWDRGLMSLALHPNFPATPVRVRLLRGRRADRRHRPHLGRPVPDAARRHR